ncbi:prepilin peptidase [Jiangella alkaliphila]|uniref:Leader peptidase (Prepilin peptidase) / N-methyltransferase n=1 Tax=Jiangella alkaliphila TaxID=419479 RepID=A0A1H2KV31_9ACTN|nr:A24 family peptidase [Jiangella alkaliphila]SDU72607.1 leader peptidase (prepilin peptidase) / N-methyltransferase [Jiangella alkaliphila]
MTLVLVLAAAGLVAGALLPLLIARIPDRPPVTVPSEPAPGPEPAPEHLSPELVEGGRPPTPIPYRELAAAPRLVLWLAVATAAVWALLALARDGAANAPEDLPAYLVAGLLGVALAYVDLRTQLLPDWLNLTALGAAGAWLTVAAALTGDWGAYGRAWAAAGACLAFYLLLALLRPADLGLGDVKLSASLGLLLGWVGWTTVASGVFLAFLAGAAIGIVLLAVGRAGRRTSLPFGPPMLVGALAALLLA